MAELLKDNIEITLRKDSQEGSSGGTRLPDGRYLTSLAGCSASVSMPLS